MNHLTQEKEKNKLISDCKKNPEDSLIITSQKGYKEMQGLVLKHSVTVKNPCPIDISDIDFKIEYFGASGSRATMSFHKELKTIRANQSRSFYFQDMGASDLNNQYTNSKISIRSANAR